jgi:hypothetical protein
VTEAQTASTPALDQAVVLAKSQFETWLKDNLDRDLNGRQRGLIARVALEIMYPTLKIAMFHDLADEMDANPDVPELFSAAIRQSAERFTREESERAHRARQ